MLHLRLQLPVGQGFFHAGWVHLSEDSPGYFYIYDCGSMTKYATACKREVKKLHGCVGNGAKLHLLVLSHMHADHVNGVPGLLKDEALKVDTIMMPLVNMEDRLLSYAATVANDPKAARTKFYRSFVVDPVAAVSRFQPRNILLVRSGKGGAPGGEPDEDGPLDGAPDIRGEGEGYFWKLVGRGSAEEKTRHSDGPIILTIPDSSALKIFEVGHWNDAWLLAPYVDRDIRRNRNVFLEALAASQSLSTSDLRNKLTDTEFLKRLLSRKKIGALRKAYKACNRDLNLTSLCLYSGPSQNSFTDHRPCAHQGHRTMCGVPGRIGWLATGDARLGKTARVEAFVAHYKALTARVATLTLPHHGSSPDFNDRLLADIDPTVCTVAAGTFKNWQHPGARVVHAVTSAGALMFVANAEETTEIAEHVRSLSTT